MDLPIDTGYEPMEAQSAGELPDGDGWLFEPKWDGFRCLAFKDGSDVELRSKNGKPLGRYFPDVVKAAGALKAKRFVLDGELVVPVGGALSFDQLQLRLHPAESRVRRLAAEHPALLVAFDLLVDERGRDLTGEPLERRRHELEAFARKYLDGDGTLRTSPAVEDRKRAKSWLSAGREGLDGVMAKRKDEPYRSGERAGMLKIKRMRSADCVVGGFRWSKNGRTIGSLLLGLYDDEGKLHHVGFCSALNAGTRAEADERLIPRRGGPGFTGKAPGGPSRWRKEGSGDYEALEHEIVVEVEYDHFTGGRFRHGTRFLRWRPDKDPQACLLEQVEREATSAIALL